LLSDELYHDVGDGLVLSWLVVEGDGRRPNLDADVLALAAAALGFIEGDGLGHECYLQVTVLPQGNI
jgi:hypothetical protein